MSDHSTDPVVGTVPVYANRICADSPARPAILPTLTVVPVRLIGGLGLSVLQLESAEASVLPGGAVTGAAGAAAAVDADELSAVVSVAVLVADPQPLTSTAEAMTDAVIPRMTAEIRG